MRERKAQLTFLFGVDDHWGPLSLLEELKNDGLLKETNIQQPATHRKWIDLANRGSSSLLYFNFHVLGVNWASNEKVLYTWEDRLIEILLLVMLSIMVSSGDRFQSRFPMLPYLLNEKTTPIVSVALRPAHYGLLSMWQTVSRSRQLVQTSEV
ncbi:hypothetical protein ACSQ67_001742 [Phaseolus vulgaris]